MNDEIIAVIGAGSAGIAAAITAARMKIPVVLIEKSGTLGGTVTNSLIHTLAGIFSFHAEPINGGIITELVQRLEKADSSTQKRKISRNWVLSCSPEVYQNVVERWVTEEPNIELRTECLIQSIECDSGCVHAITIADNSNHCRIGLRGLIDTTGSGQALQLVDTGLVDASGPLASDGQIFVLRGVAPEALGFPDNVKYTHAIRKAGENGQLPP